MHNKSVAELSRELESGKISSVELTRQFLGRLEKEDEQLNSFITITEEQALADAHAADEQRAAGKATPWTGVPFAHKDIFCTNGVATTCGSKMLANFVPPYDATVTENFRKAGAVCLGKTNMDEFAMGSSTESSYFGATANPWGLSRGEKRVPGGSSGGSAAAVAARLVPAATATDTGGSIRQPAALCGVTGLKPTYGRVSRYGMIAFASSLDQGGTMARTAEDNALMLNVMAGFDPKDSTSIDRDVPDYTATLNEPLTGLRIGLPKEYFAGNLSAFPTLTSPSRPTTLSPRPRPRPTCPVLTAPVMATAAKTRKTCWTCTHAPGPKVSAPRSSGGFWWAPTRYPPAISMRTTSRLRKFAG